MGQSVANKIERSSQDLSKMRARLRMQDRSPSLNSSISEVSKNLQPNDADLVVEEESCLTEGAGGQRKRQQPDSHSGISHVREAQKSHSWAHEPDALEMQSEHSNV